QAKINLLKNLVIKGGVRYEKINIGVKDYATLPTKNTQNGNITPSIAVKGGDLKYNTFVFNTGIRYNISEYFSPYVSFSQGFSVSDIGLVLRAAKVNDIAKINTEPVVVNNYEVGFVSKVKNIRFEATGYISKSELGANSVFVNGVYAIVRSPERIHGFELVADVTVNKNIQTGISYSYVEGKTDVNNNGKFDDKEDQYLGGQRIGAPKISGHFDYAIIPGKFTAIIQYTGVLSRNRFDKNSSGSYDPFKGPVNPYHLVSSLVSYNINQSTSVNVGVENLLNENYFTARSQWGTWNDSYTKGKGASYRFTLNIKL
ncbi:MAG: TonB-dependent receptor, partial [Sediminibacterium sp.]|nr:TonB-dependent receptor [Sediminibacterium sp.]